MLTGNKAYSETDLRSLNSFQRLNLLKLDAVDQRLSADQIRLLVSLAREEIRELELEANGRLED